MDQLSDAVSKLILIEERQMTQAQRIHQVEMSQLEAQSAQRATDAKLEKWINRGVGIWFLAGLAFAVVSVFVKFIK